MNDEWRHKEGSKLKKPMLGIGSGTGAFDRDAISCQYLIAERFVKSILKWKCPIPKTEFSDISEVIIRRLIDVLEYTPTQIEDRKSQQLHFLADVIACWMSGILSEAAQDHEEKLQERCRRKQEEMEADEDEDDDDDDEDDDLKKYDIDYKGDSDEDEDEDEETSVAKRKADTVTGGKGREEGVEEAMEEIEQETEEEYKTEDDVEKEEIGVETMEVEEKEMQTQDPAVEIEMEAQAKVEIGTETAAEENVEVGVETKPLSAMEVETEAKVETEEKATMEIEEEAKGREDEEGEGGAEAKVETIAETEAEIEVEDEAVADTKTYTEEETAEPTMNLLAEEAERAEELKRVEKTEEAEGVEPVEQAEQVEQVEEAEKAEKAEDTEEESEKIEIGADEMDKVGEESLSKILEKEKVITDMLIPEDLEALFKSDLPFVTFGKIIDTVYKMIENVPENTGTDPITNGIHRVIYEKLNNIVMLENPELLTEELKDIMDVVCGKIANWLR